MIAIVDYGMGNLASVAKACARLGFKAQVTSSPAAIRRASAVILPGVGAFGAAMRELKRRGLVNPLRESIDRDRPFLGLCLGLHLLFESSAESPGVKGLAVLPGRVQRFSARKNLKIPHMGWNQICKRGDNPLLAGIPEGTFMYFVHSFYAVARDPKVVAAKTQHGIAFPSVVWNGQRAWATQFHPEKSQRWGLKLLKNFLEMARC